LLSIADKALENMKKLNAVQRQKRRDDLRKFLSNNINPEYCDNNVTVFCKKEVMNSESLVGRAISARKTVLRDLSEVANYYV